MDRLAGRGIIVTGATGIAAASARRFATEGATVVIISRTAASCEALAEEIVAGEQPEDRLFAHAGQKASEALEEPLSDIHAPEEYRRHLARVLTQRALAEAATRAGGAA